MKIENKTITAYYGNKGYGKTYHEKIRLEKENKELQQRLDKAIKEITKNKYIIDISKVLEILKGEDNED